MVHQCMAITAPDMIRSRWSFLLSTLKDRPVRSIKTPSDRDEKNTLPKVIPREGRSIHLAKSPARPKSRTEILRYMMARLFIAVLMMIASDFYGMIIHSCGPNVHTVPVIYDA